MTKIKKDGIAEGIELLSDYVVHLKLMCQL